MVDILGVSADIFLKTTCIEMNRQLVSLGKEVALQISMLLNF